MMIQKKHLLPLTQINGRSFLLKARRSCFTTMSVRKKSDWGKRSPASSSPVFHTFIEPVFEKKDLSLRHLYPESSSDCPWSEDRVPLPLSLHLRTAAKFYTRLFHSSFAPFFRLNCLLFIARIGQSLNLKIAWLAKGGIKVRQVFLESKMSYL